MIESISIAKTATYGDTPEVMSGLSQLNYIYGSNGTGKTTIARVIANEEKYSECPISWKGGTKLETLVYDSDFVDRSYNQPTELGGVFTLGEKQADTLAKITVAKAELDIITTKIEGLTHGLQGEDGTGGKKAELDALESFLKDKCWAQKLKYDAKFQGAFEGCRGNSGKFKERVLQESQSNNATLLILTELEKKAESIFGSTPIVEQLVPIIEVSKLLDYETDTILKKRVIGKEDVDIATIIKKLGNSDWVREGKTFYDENERVCPFCQQRTTDLFAHSLNEYFDEAFAADNKAINDLATNYSADAARLQQQLALIITGSSKFLNIERMKAEKDLLDSKITINNQRLSAKVKEASQVVELESLSSVVEAIKLLIATANTLTTEHNNMVVNLSSERNTLIAQVWRYVLEELKVDLAKYKTEREGLEKAVKALTDQVELAVTDKTKKIIEVKQLEKQTTSVEPTIDAINTLLTSFGFQGFMLAKAAGGTSYKLVRSDGSDAKKTLSEGEKTFVTFLYFYHLLKGSESDSGMTANRVVVFDDPVSSLDSEVLFIVGSLIRELFEEIRAKTGHIKQIFVLTHNVYFHKEITFSTKRRNNVAMKEETFWIVKKNGNVSTLANYKYNPIHTSYELLWSEVRKPSASTLTIQNTLRRILDNYFRYFGGVDPKELCRNFSGKEKALCNSLLSWVNDGSHYAQDDLYVSTDDTTVDTYLDIFRAIFEKSGHLPHYKMMMGSDYKESQVDTVSAEEEAIS